MDIALVNPLVVVYTTPQLLLLYLYLQELCSYVVREWGVKGYIRIFLIRFVLQVNRKSYGSHAH